MPELRSYRRHEVPRDLAWQVRSFTRVQWPQLESAKRPWWDFTPREHNSLHFVLTEGDLLVSHASVNWRDVEHKGQTYNVFGLSTIGGDVVRGLYLADGQQRALALNSVIFDRVSGLASSRSALVLDSGSSGGASGVRSCSAA